MGAPWIVVPQYDAGTCLLLRGSTNKPSTVMLVCIFAARLVLVSAAWLYSEDSKLLSATA